MHIRTSWTPWGACVAIGVLGGMACEVADENPRTCERRPDGTSCPASACKAGACVDGTPSAGSATIAWDAPTVTEDGAPLTSLAGYTVHYGTAPSAYSGLERVPPSACASAAGVTTCQFTVQPLTSGTWFFAVTALGPDGIESIASNEVSKTVP